MTELTEAAVRRYATDKSFQRGRSYYRSGAVLSLARRGDQLVAEVEGSRYEPYRVRVTLDEAGLVDADCSCPYDWGGYCKHIVAVLLTAIREPEEIEERPAMASLLEDLDADQLRELLLSLVEGRPGLEEALEARASTLRAQPSRAGEEPRQRQTALDPEPFRRQVRYALRSLDHMRPSEAYWHVGGVVDEVRHVLDQAWDYIEAGDGNSALVILGAITDEYVSGWFYLDGSSGETGEFFWELGEAWTEALLSADLTPEEGAAWVERLEQWQAEVGDYGIDDAFFAAIDAAWFSQEDLSSYEADECEGLTEARLNVLARQERYEDYLELARASGESERYVTMLTQLGRVEEAVGYGLAHLTEAGEALALAEALREQDAIEEAIQVAEHGLELEGYGRARLATWLRDVASGLGRSELALEAALVAFHESPDLADYQAVESLAGEAWAGLRRELLDDLRRRETYSPRPHVDVFLHEGLVEDAIAAVEGHAYSYDLLERVVDAALETRTRPDWVIRVGRHQAERIIEPGKSAHYHHAVNWLAKARDAYRIAGREDEWREYFGDILARHGRKYKLMPMLEALK